jgi:glycosyltransferase 2 family protein
MNPETAAAPAIAPFTDAKPPTTILSHRLLRLLAKLAISAGLIWFVCRNVDPAGVGPRFAGQSPPWLVAATIATLAQILLAALRWQQVLKALGIEIPAGKVLSTTFIGSFFNCWLLGSGSGDVARAVLAPADARGRSAIVHSVLFDRAATFAGIGVTVLPVVVFNIGPLARGIPVLVSLAVVTVPFIGLIWLERVVDLVIRWRLPMAGLAGNLVESWQRLRRSWPRFLLALALAAVSEVTISATAYCLARAQHLDISLVDFLALMPAVLLLGALPISVGGWGVRENVLVLALAPIGIAAGAALLIGVEIGFLGAVLTLPGGAIWLLRHVLRRQPAATPAVSI